MWTQIYLIVKIFWNWKAFKILTKSKKTAWLIKIQKCKTNISITAKNFLNRKQSQRKQLDWLKLKNARQPYQLQVKIS